PAAPPPRPLPAALPIWPNVLKVRGPAVAAALAGKDPGGATFNVDSIRKDLRTMLEEARALGRELPVTQRTLAPERARFLEHGARSEEHTSELQSRFDLV